jgi:hypothetical protein
MSKYSNSQLKEMATEALKAKSTGNLNWFALVQTMSVILRMHPQHIEQGIVKLSELEE